MPGGFFGSLGRPPVPGLLQPTQQPFGFGEGEAPSGAALSPAEKAALLQAHQAYQAQMRRRQETVSGLPEAVQRSILQQPSYGEGEAILGPHNPLMEQELGARMAPQRENDLDANVRFADHLRRFGMYAMPEGAYPPRLGHEQQPPQPPFASPLGPYLQRRGPFALY